MITLIILVAALVFLDSVTQHRIDNPDIYEREPYKTFAESDFSSVAGAMMALFQSTTGGREWRELYELIGLTGVLSKLVFLAYVVFFIFAFLNIITSIFVDRVMQQSQPDHEELMLAKRGADHKAAIELKKLISSLDEHGDGLISEEELMALNTHPDVAMQLEMAGLNIKDVSSFFETLCNISGTKELDIDTFVEAAFQMKGLACSVDVQTILFEVKDINRTVKELGIRGARG